MFYGIFFFTSVRNIILLGSHNTVDFCSPTLCTSVSRPRRRAFKPWTNLVKLCITWSELCTSIDKYIKCYSVNWNCIYICLQLVVVSVLLPFNFVFTPTHCFTSRYIVHNTTTTLCVYTDAIHFIFNMASNSDVDARVSFCFTRP